MSGSTVVDGRAERLLERAKARRAEALANMDIQSHAMVDMIRKIIDIKWRDLDTGACTRQGVLTKDGDGTDIVLWPIGDQFGLALTHRGELVFAGYQPRMGRIYPTDDKGRRTDQYLVVTDQHLLHIPYGTLFVIKNTLHNF